MKNRRSIWDRKEQEQAIYILKWKDERNGIRTINNKLKRVISDGRRMMCYANKHSYAFVISQLSLMNKFR